MNREIKFRAWPTHDTSPFMVHWGLDDGDNRWPNNDGDFDGWEVMQYTGLTDKNGTEIYEGDIVSTYHFNGAVEKTAAVEWGHDMWMWGVHGNIRVAFDWYRGGCEIIGNIYEHGDLLDVQAS